MSASGRKRASAVAQVYTAKELSAFCQKRWPMVSQRLISFLKYFSQYYLCPQTAASGTGCRSGCAESLCS